MFQSKIMLSFETLTKKNTQLWLTNLLILDKEIEGISWNDTHFLIDMDSKWDLSLVVKLGEEVIGFAILSKKSDRYVHIHRIVVNSNNQGKGIGRMMMNEIFSRAKTKNFLYVSLKVPQKNKKAFLFYRNVGVKELFFKDNNYFRTIF